MKKLLTILTLATTGSFAFGSPETYKVFVSPHSTTSTSAKTINNIGVTKGEYWDGRYHCFIRSASGAITEFEPTGSSGSSVGLLAIASPEAGGGQLVAGSYYDSAFVNHGYIRLGTGSIVAPIDVPGSINTWITTVNPMGNAAGYYSDASHINHGFVRAANGTIQTFSAPGATIGTYVFGRSANNTIIGEYWNISGHGYCKIGNVYTTLDPAGSFNTRPIDINVNEVITGEWTDSFGNVHGFVVDVSDTANIIIVPFDVPGSTYTSARAINSSGTVVGAWDDTAGLTHGFIRSIDGDFTTFDVPGMQSTVGMAINDNGVVAGQCADTIWHGFIRTP